MDLAIQNHARANLERGGLSHRVNRFTVRIDPDNALRFLNYAVPDDQADPSAGEIAELIGFFAAHDRLPRLEYLPGRAPALTAALEAAGFGTESVMPLMVCAPGDAVAASVPGITIAAPDGTDRFVEAVTVQYAAFGEPDAPSMDEVTSMMIGPVRRGGTALVAIDTDGGVVGAGQYSAPIDGTTEVAGIAVAERHRGRGIGAALTSALTLAAHAAGCHTVWLDPSGETAQRLYRRAGYRVVGQKRHMVLEPA